MSGGPFNIDALAASLNGIDADDAAQILAYHQLAALHRQHRKGVPCEMIGGHDVGESLVAGGLAYWRNPRKPNRLLPIPQPPATAGTPRKATMREPLIDIGQTAHPDLFDRLEPARREALQLIAAVHEGRDRETWGGIHYWTQLAERAQLARIAGPTISDWWCEIAKAMSVTLWPSNRAEVNRIIAANNPSVLTELSDSTALLIELLRLCVDEAKTAKTDTGQVELPL